MFDAATTDGAVTFARGLGTLHFSYLAIRLPRGVNVTVADTVRHSYPDPWMERYLRRTYQFYDPVVEVAGRTRLPFHWGHGDFLRRFGKAQQRVFHEAKAFQITEGYSIPVHGPDGDSGVFSISAPRRKDVDEAVAACAPLIQLFAVQFHDAVMKQLGARPPCDAPDLSKRELECLAWTAEGLTTEAIAARLNLSASAVNYHLGNAGRKLGASGKHHAAVLAIRLGILR